MMNRVVSILLLLASTSLAQAHPHNWIQLDSIFVLNGQAQLIEIKQTWEFDFYYSLMMHADLMNEFGDEEAGLALCNDINTGTVFINRSDYLDPSLPWNGIKDSGRGCSLSYLGYQQLTRPKSIHIKRQA